MHDAVIVNRGFQALNTVHFNHHIKCVAQRAAEAVAVHYTIGSSHVTSVLPFLSHEPQSKHSVDGDISQLIYIKKYRLYVAFCLDLTLRVFSEHFDPIQTVHVTATVLSFVFNENTSELYCGGVGCFEVWQLQHQLHSPLIHGKAISCSVGQHQWVVSLYHEVCVEKLVIACQDAIYVIDVQSHKQTDMFSNGHESSITSAVLCPQMDYLISAAKDGSIKVWNCILHTEVHTFSGHLKAVTGLKLHPLSHCVISSSFDGTMRMWSLESMIESYRLDCGEELLGFSCDFPTGVRMACFSNQNVKMWIVNKVEAHFATVNSHVVSMSRVEGLSSTQPARILALAEDGGVRLLSPVTGQVVSILFPMFSSQILHEVAYSLSEGLLFALLRNSEVLVFSTLTNPCTAAQLWTCPTNQDSVTCIALCTIVVQTDHQSSVQSLVFGGQKCGHISLLHGTGLSMPHPCPAHAGHVIKLTSPTCPIDPKSSNPALVSYGSDNMLNIWSLEVKRGSQNAVLKIRVSINLEPCPIHIGLLHSTICLALADNRIVQLNISPDSRYESQSFGALPLLTHQSEDDHTEAVTSLSSCSHLKLFATSSSDGHVKVWSTDNHLVSEIHFGASLASVGFANPRGDLLVGFQKHICIVEAENYLPAAYTDVGTEYPYSDGVEEPVPFDPDLEFWYDPARVPSLPAHQEKRKLLPTQTCDPSCDVLQEEERHPIRSGATSADCAASKRSLQFCHAHMVDRPLARELSSQYFASLEPEHRRKGNILKLPSQESLTVKEDCSGVIVTDRGSSQLGHNLDDCKHSVLASISELPGDSQSVTSSSNSFTLDSQSKTPPAAEILPLESASSKFPIAPDGLVPNSIIRAQIGYIPPEVIIPPHRPKLKAKQPHSAVQKNSWPLAKPREHLSGENLQGRASSTHTERDGEVITCISEFLEPGSPVEKTTTAQFSQSSNWQKSPSGTGSGGAASYHSKGIGMDDAATTQGPSLHVHGSSSARRHSIEAKPKVVTRFEPPLEEQVRSRKASRQSHEGRRLSSSNASKSLAPSPRRRSSTREPQLPGSLSCNHSMCRDRATSPMVVQRSQSSVNASSVHMCNTISSASLEKRMDVEKLLQQITSQPWYPILRKGSTGSATAVVDTLVSMLKTTQMPIFHKVGSALLELEEASLITEDQRQSAVHQTLGRLKSKAKSMKAAVLKILEWLGIGGREVTLAVLPLLTDSDLELRNAAFGTLKRLAGIVNRAQLHQLLIEFGLLQNVVTNEDEVLRALSARIKAGQVKAPAMWYSQESSQRSRDILKSKPLYERETAALATGTALSASYNPKHGIDMEDPTQADSEKPDHLTTDTDVEQLSPRHQSPAMCTAKLPKVYMQVRERAIPPVDSLAQPQSNKRTRDYYNRAGFPQHYSDPQQQRNTPTATMFNTDLNPCSKLHRLIAHNPTAFSQTKPAINMMLGAYTKNKTTVNVESDDYAWSEVFPVIKAASAHKRSTSLPNKPFLPRLDVLTSTCTNGERRMNTQVQDTDMAVKLPKITVSRIT